MNHERTGRILHTVTLVTVGCLLASAVVHAATPIENELQKLLAADGAPGDQFGRSVALTADTAVIGACGDDDKGVNSGAAYVYTRGAAGIWTLQAKLTATDDAPGDRFGFSVALAGDTAVIGAFGDDDKGVNSGAAYVYTRDAPGIWTLQAKLTATDSAPDDRFGFSVALDGDTALIGTERDSDKEVESGAAYVYTRDASGAWIPQAKLTASDDAPGDFFGESVALDGDTALIGARGDDGKGSFSGAAYIYTRSAAGVWSIQAKLTADDGAPFDLFGDSVALDGNTAVIGTPLDGDKGSGFGAAYVYTRSAADVWTLQAKLTAADDASGDRFGWSVALDGDTAVIGAHTDNGKGSGSGAAYIYTRNAAGDWQETDKLLASDGSVDDVLSFGTRGVSLSGHTAIAGAPFRDEKGSNSGAAYVFNLHTVDEPPLNLDVMANPTHMVANW